MSELVILSIGIFVGFYIGVALMCVVIANRETVDCPPE